MYVHFPLLTKKSLTDKEKDSMLSYTVKLFGVLDVVCSHLIDGGVSEANNLKVVKSKSIKNDLSSST